MGDSQRENVIYASGWQWIDGNRDTVAECYFFDENGFMISNTTTSDGYKVNSEGMWVNANNEIYEKNIEDISYDNVSLNEGYLNAVKNYDTIHMNAGYIFEANREKLNEEYIEFKYVDLIDNKSSYIKNDCVIYTPIYYSEEYVNNLSSGDKIEIYSTIFYSYNKTCTVKDILKEKKGHYKIFSVEEEMVEYPLYKREFNFAFDKKDDRYVLCVLDEAENENGENWLEEYNGYDNYGTTNDRRHYNIKPIYKGKLYFSKNCKIHDIYSTDGDVEIHEIADKVNLSDRWETQTYSFCGEIVGFDDAGYIKDLRLNMAG